MKCVPAWQGKADPSPGSRSNEQTSLPAKIGERMHLAGHVREGEIRRLERRQPLALAGAQPEVPGGERFISGDRLIYQLRKGQKIEECFAGVFANEFRCA